MFKARPDFGRLDKASCVGLRVPGLQRIEEVNYFPFHLGDYAAHTAHLEPMEDLAYRRMLDLYYLHECALPQDAAEIARLIRMRGNVEEIEAVLREFFLNNDGEGWIHTRCEAEISKMQDKQAKARASAAASVKARSTNAQRTLNERSTDVELPTPTPTPTPKVVDSGPVLRPEPPPQPAGLFADADDAQQGTKSGAQAPNASKAIAPQPPPPFDGKNAEILNGKHVVQLAASFELPEQWGIDAEALGWKPSEVLHQAERMRQWATEGKGKGTRRSVKGWRQTWSNWLEKAAKDHR